MSPDDPRHGTPAGHVKHRRDGEVPCNECRRAATRACREYEARQPLGLTDGHWEIDLKRRVQVWVRDPVVMRPAEWRQLQQEAS